MNNTINSLPAKQKLEDIIGKYNPLIFDEEKWIWKDLRKIAEVTYSYDTNTWINTTLFVKWGWLNIETYKMLDLEAKKVFLLRAKEKLEELINEKIDLIDEALETIDRMDSLAQTSVETDTKSIFKNSLIEKKMLLEYCLTALALELEKADIWFKVDETEEKEIETKIQEYDKLLFWGDIKDSPQDVILSYESALVRFNKNKHLLTESEAEKFEWYLKKMLPYLPEGYKYVEKVEPKAIDNSFLETDFLRSDYILWFNILIEALEKLEHIVESNSDVASISDWPKGVYFPTSAKFAKMNILRFFKLANHEIETHNITDYNWRQLIWNLRWAWSIEKDEWVAMLMEQLFMYWEELYKIDENWNKIIDRDKIQINSYFSKIFMWELLDEDKELMDFLNIYEKLEADVIPPKARLDRLKRNNKSHVQHKDTTYTRWLFKAVDNINLFITSKWKKWINPKDLFIWKVSFDETSTLKNIAKQKEKNWEDLELLTPLFISDAVLFAVEEKLKWRNGNISWENFYKYLQNKYPIFNFSKEQIKAVSHTTKTNVFWIVEIILKRVWLDAAKNISSDNTAIQYIIWDTHQYNIKKVKDKMKSSERKNAK